MAWKVKYGRLEKVIAMSYHTRTISGMKQAGILLLLFIASLSLSCAERAMQEPVPEYRLTGTAEESWKKIKDAYYQYGFAPCLAGKKIVVSCGGCTGVILRGIIHIDKNGKVEGFTKTFDRYCGSSMPPDVEECFMKFFKYVDFPPELRGLSIQIDLGRALKC
jgi:hypothetical protein